MRNFNNIQLSKNYKGSALAIGNFDGLHKGHQKVFKQSKKFAKKNKIKFGVMTFNPLPVMFFNKKITNHRLVSNEHKLRLFKKYGVDFTINISDAEGFGLSTLESLSCGVPIVANMTGGLQEQITDGVEEFGIPIFPHTQKFIKL